METKQKSSVRQQTYGKVKVQPTWKEKLQNDIRNEVEKAKQKKNPK